MVRGERDMGMPPSTAQALQAAQPRQATQPCRILVITGLPGVGKTTLARLLARRYGLPLLAKDTIKEPLLDVLEGAPPDRERSRLLSNASFAVLFGLAREQLSLGSSLILEGNFRKGEHERELDPQRLAGGSLVCLAQVLCSVPEAERQHRLLARHQDPSRHPGHRDAELLTFTAGAEPLDLPGERFPLTTSQGGPPAQWLATLDQWMGAG